ncbi:MAG: ribonuclease P protein component [Flavobacteriaceae bacterium]|nr:ribonuclease P protein component [Flavobacteriaceae bacterium]|tara:strand:- start:9295 stop:9654 length:360 start_codon:yes stop_codon:yes gene_type:complete
MFSKRRTEIKRLKSKQTIESLFSEGTHFGKEPIKLVCDTQKGKGLALGFGVSKRLFRKAVDRNKIKRLMREQSRIICSDPLYTPFEGNGFFVYNAQELPSLDTIEKAMLPLLKRWNDLQ